MEVTVGELRELVRQSLLKEAMPAPQQSFITYQDWQDYIAQSKKIASVNSPITLWVNRTSTTGDKNPDSPLYGSGMKPRDMIDVVKKDLVSPNGTILSMPDRQRAWNDIAHDLAIDVRKRAGNKLRSKTVVVSVPSRSEMASALAQRVANDLKVPYVSNVLKKLEKGDQIEFNEREWFDYIDRNDARKQVGEQHQSDEKLDSFYKQMQALQRSLQKKLGAGIALSAGDDIPQRHRRFFNIVKVAGQLNDAETVIIVDDNTDTDWTLRHIAREISDTGKQPVMAVGYDRSATA